MIQEIQSLMDQYTTWLRDQTALREVGPFVEITTPFLDRHNDHLQIYAKRDNGDFLLTDDGYIIEDLQMSGCRLDSKRREKLLEVVLNGFGVQMDGTQLITRATRRNFAARKHSLVQAMLAVNDMFFTAAPTAASLFYEDVAGWLELNDIRFVPSVKFTGRSNLDHVFDFAIPKSKGHPERIVQAINRPNRETAEVLTFAWIDTKDARPVDSEAYAILNDFEKPISPTIISALESYEIHAVPWAERDAFKSQLAA
jgi:hypothetical protein